MTDYHINDDWVLRRIMDQSSAFAQWFTDIMVTVEKSLEVVDPETAEKLKKKRDLGELKDLDGQFKKADEKLAEVREKILGLGSMGNFIATLTTDIVRMGLESSLKPKKDIDIDFITGKRKSLSSALYDVTRERGIDSEGILYLIGSLPDLESFLYSTSVKKYYRDHTEHQLRVAVLGDFLLEQSLEQGNLLNIVAEVLEMDKQLLKDKIWWITGLIHDIGYPLSKMTTAINWSLLNQILKCYPLLDVEVVPMEVTLSWKGKFQEAYLTLLEEGLSKEAREQIRSGAGFNYEKVPVPSPQVFLGGEKGHSEFTFQSSVALDHGVVGALTLLRSLGTPEEIRENEEDFKGYIVAAQAIALHNFKGKLKDFTFDENPLAFLLVLIDEMQEWGRPIPLQIRDSYFTTELKKVALLDEVLLTVDEFTWLMQYKNADVKKLVKFDFARNCEDKEKAFFRLDKGSKFQETVILLQDYGGADGRDISQVISEAGKGVQPNASKMPEKQRSLLKRSVSPLKKSEKKTDIKLLSEVRIKI